MEKPPEEYIENYVRYPSDLSAKEILWIEEWIQKDCEVRLLVDWFRDFYATVDKVEEAKTSTSDKPYQIHLQLFDEGKSDSKAIFDEKLAFPKEESAQKIVRTFISEEYKTILRILHSKDTNRSKFHVISEFVDAGDAILIKIPDEDILFVSDSEGFAEIPDTISPENIRNWAQCLLYLPITKADVYRDKRTNYINIDSLNTDRENSSIEIKTIEDEIEVSIDMTDKSSPQKAVLHSNKETNVLTLRNGSCSIPIKKIPTSGATLFFF